MLQNRAQYQPKDDAHVSPWSAKARSFPALVHDAEIQAAAAETEIVIGDAGRRPFFVPSAGRLVVADHTLHSPAAAVYLRWGLELAWLKGRAPLDPALCELLAARFAAVCAEANGENAASLLYLKAFAVEAPDDRALAALWRELAARHDLTFVPLETTYARVRMAWSLAAPAHHIMASGMRPTRERDVARLMRPDPEAVHLSSCTASSVSVQGYRAAELCRRRILGDVVDRGNTNAFGMEASRTRAAIASHFAVADLAESVLAPSGTDAALIATAIAVAASAHQPTTAIVLGATETGSGVPDAVSGRHYSNLSPLGDAAVPGAAIDGFGAMTLQCLALRDAQGIARPIDDIEQDIIQAVEQAATAGRVVLHALDASKTGLQVPRLEFLDTLAQRFGAALDIVVDASQGRLCNARARGYLARGHILIVTGSKFVGGPPFSGAVLVPKDRFDLGKGLPAGLRSYSCAADWPRAVDTVLRPGNPGLLLRWAAALSELTAFARIAPKDIRKALARFAADVQHGVTADSRLVPFPGLSDKNVSEGWDAVPTIFAFGVRDPADSRDLLDCATLRRVQEWLARDLSLEFPESPAAGYRCHIGQPVEVARGTWALRIAAGSRLVHTLAAQASDAKTVEVDHTLAKLGLILDRWSTLAV